MSAHPWLTDEHRRFQPRVREFALARIAPAYPNAQELLRAVSPDGG